MSDDALLTLLGSSQDSLSKQEVQELQNIIQISYHEYITKELQQIVAPVSVNTSSYDQFITQYKQYYPNRILIEQDVYGTLFELYLSQDEEQVFEKKLVEVLSVEERKKLQSMKSSGVASTFVTIPDEETVLVPNCENPDCPNASVTSYDFFFDNVYPRLKYSDFIQFSPDERIAYFYGFDDLEEFQNTQAVAKRTLFTSFSLEERAKYFQQYGMMDADKEVLSFAIKPVADQTMLPSDIGAEVKIHNKQLDVSYRSLDGVEMKGFLQNKGNAFSYGLTLKNTVFKTNTLLIDILGSESHVQTEPFVVKRPNPLETDISFASAFLNK